MPEAPAVPAVPARENGVVAHIDLQVWFRGHCWVSGWAVHPTAGALTGVAYVLPGDEPVPVPDHGLGRESPEAAAAHGPAHGRSRWILDLIEGDPDRFAALELELTFADGRRFRLDDLCREALAADPYHVLSNRFFADLRSNAGLAVLELGSRNRSGIVRRELVHPESSYTGVDVLAGENVDVVGDAHELSRYLPADTYDRVFTVSTFEHLAMPWKVALELNKVMRTGGELLVTTHQSWPLHEEPWDFWRFSSHSWPALFNRYTGFEILETAMGEPGSVAGDLLHAPTLALSAAPARLASACRCRKTGPAEVRWDVPLPEIMDTAYPQ